MSVTYATVTSKGQMTLPVELRRELGIEPGQTVGFRRTGGQVVLESAANVDTVRSRLERAARARGTWGAVPDDSPAWQDAVVARHADS